MEAATGKELSGGVIAVDDFSLISGSCPPSSKYSVYVCVCVCTYERWNQDSIQYQIKAQQLMD